MNLVFFFFLIYLFKPVFYVITFGQNEMSFHCCFGIFVNYFFLTSVLLQGVGEIFVLYEHVLDIYWYY